MQIVNPACTIGPLDLKFIERINVSEEGKKTVPPNYT